MLSSPQGLRRYEYSLRWDYGDISPGDPAFINVDEFVVLYRGWWEEVSVIILSSFGNDGPWARGK